MQVVNHLEKYGRDNDNRNDDYKKSTPILPLIYTYSNDTCKNNFFTILN